MGTAADRVYRSIKKGILDGQYPAGSYVRETSIGKQLEVSRTPIREALSRLASEGWVETIAHHGARVVSWTRKDVEEVFELRALLEPLAVQRTANNIGDADLEQLGSLAGQMEELAVDPEDAALESITQLNSQFHACMIEAADSPRLRRLMDAIVQMPVGRRSFEHYTPQELRRSMDHHREIISALAAGDGEWAASVMRAHVLAARGAHLRSILTGSVDTRSAEGEDQPDTNENAMKARIAR